MADGVTFYEGSESVGGGPSSTQPAEPKTSGYDGTQFYDGSEQVSCISGDAAGSPSKAASGAPGSTAGLPASQWQGPDQVG